MKLLCLLYTSILLFCRTRIRYEDAAMFDHFCSLHTYVYVIYYIYNTYACSRKLRRNWPPLRYIGYSQRDVTSLRITTQMHVTHARVNDTKKSDRPLCYSFTSIPDSITKKHFHSYFKTHLRFPNLGKNTLHVL